MSNDDNKKLNTSATSTDKSKASWQFLYAIAEKVNNFSDKDKDLLRNIGQVLFNSGTRYIHDYNQVSTNKSTSNISQTISNNNLSK